MLSHPAPFGDYKLDLLRLAARQADIGAVSFISEPKAAAVHYSTLQRIGGIDLDHAVLQHVLTSIDRQGPDLIAEHADHASAMARLRHDCRSAKEALSAGPCARRA